MEKKHYLNIEVTFASQNMQKVINIRVEENTSIDEAIKLSKIQNYFSDFNLMNLPVGIFGKNIDKTNYKLKNNDRIEIYRTLSKSPNQKRIERIKNE